MPCDHVICLVCVTNWIERERTCPLCKQDIPDDFKILSTKSIRYSKVILIQENNLKFRTKRQPSNFCNKLESIISAI